MHPYGKLLCPAFSSSTKINIWSLMSLWDLEKSSPERDKKLCTGTYREILLVHTCLVSFNESVYK